MQQKRRRRAFTAAYKAEVVELCRKGDRSISETARDLDLTESSVRRWVEQAEIDAGRRPGLTSSVQEEPGAARGARHPEAGDGFLRVYVNLPGQPGELARFFAARLRLWPAPDAPLAGRVGPAGVT